GRLLLDLAIIRSRRRSDNAWGKLATSLTLIAARHELPPSRAASSRHRAVLSRRLPTSENRPSAQISRRRSVFALGADIGKTVAVLDGAASSTMWQLVPPKPNELTPARGSSSGHGQLSSSVCTLRLRASKSM